MIQHFQGQDYCLRCGGPANTFSCPECDGVEYTGHYWTPSEVIDPCWDEDYYNPAPWYDRLYCWWFGYLGPWNRLKMFYRCWGFRVDQYFLWYWIPMRKDKDIPF
jgi:hypothetical protein